MQQNGRYGSRPQAPPAQQQPAYFYAAPAPAGTTPILMMNQIPQQPPQVIANGGAPAASRAAPLPLHPAYPFHPQVYQYPQQQQMAAATPAIYSQPTQQPQPQRPAGIVYAAAAPRPGQVVMQQPTAFYVPASSKPQYMPQPLTSQLAQLSIAAAGPAEQVKQELEAEPKRCAAKKQPKQDRQRREKAVAADQQIVFYLNGEKTQVDNVDVATTLNDYLRDRPDYHGTKFMCGEGGCGSCTVAIDMADDTGATKTLAINSCLRPLASCHGLNVTTIEGLNGDAETNPISKKLADSNGSQCGFCSVGMVMSMYSLLKEKPKPTQQEVEDHFDGNLCRCTGYRPILDAMKSFAGDAASAAPGSQCSADIEDLCRRTGTCVKKAGEAPKSALQFRDALGMAWYAPATLDALLQLLKSAPAATKKFVVGNTSIGVYKDQKPDMWIYIRDITELQKTEKTAAGLTMGGAVTVSRFMSFLEETAAADKSVRTAFIPVLLRHLKLVASPQVRNVGSVSGNLMMVHNWAFTSDIWTILMAVGAELRLLDINGNFQNVPLFGFEKVDMTNRIIYSITVPWATVPGGFDTHKTMVRHVNSHAIVNAGFRVELDSSYRVTKLPTLAYGGVQKYPCRAEKVEEFLVGRSWSDPATLKYALALLQTSLVPTIDPTEGRVAYRSSLILTLFYKFYLAQLPASSLPPQLESAMHHFVRPVSSGEQSYGTDPSEYPISQAIPKIDGVVQTSGKAVYADDVTPNNAAYADFVLTTVATGDIVSVDPSAALQLPGVIAWISAKDIQPDRNTITTDPVPVEWHEPVFADKKVIYNGQPIGLIVAESYRRAREAVQLVKVTYDVSKAPKPVLSLDEAISRNSFFPPYPGTTPVGPFTTGDLSKGFAQSKHVLQNSVSVGSQYHFHMETQSSVAIPVEGQAMKVISSTQWPSLMQNLISRVTGVNSSKITVETRRVGGAYGGKITRSAMVATAAAVASKKLKRPVKLSLDINTNMEMVGKRHPFRCDYKVGFDDNGKINALQMTLYADGGCSYDSTAGTVDMALTSADNCYFVPNYAIEGKLCFTNLPSNTPTRAPGCVPAIYFMESVVESVSAYLGLSPDVVKPLNFYAKGQTTPYGQPLPYFSLGSLWDQLKASCNYDARKAQVQLYNSNNRWTKRGISLVPLKYGISWAGAKYGCQVNIYMDGTVGVGHSGVEVGQGINTKVAQCVAHELGIPLDLIAIDPTNSFIATNADPTGGSITSGLNSKIVMEACDILNKRLAPLRTLMRQDKRTEPTWQELITKAYAAGVELRAHAWITAQTPNPFAYNSYAVACTEVQVDILTGATEVLQTDILFDCGVSLNPDVDIGQVEGAFIQGLGYFLTEYIEYDPSGKLVTNGTWEYKPPSQKDIPIRFNVALLKDAPNPVGVMRSKASGEPPYCVACSVYFAVKQALASARAEVGQKGDFALPAPATVWNAQQAAGVQIEQLYW